MAVIGTILLLNLIDPEDWEIQTKRENEKKILRQKESNHDFFNTQFIFQVPLHCIQYKEFVCYWVERGLNLILNLISSKKKSIFIEKFNFPPPYNSIKCCAHSGFNQPFSSYSWFILRWTESSWINNREKFNDDSQEIIWSKWNESKGKKSDSGLKVVRVLDVICSGGMWGAI